MRTLQTAIAMIALATLSTAARAQTSPEYLKRTDLTFSGPVRLPSMSLPAGTYRFELADPDEQRRVVRVMSEDGKKTYGLLLSVPDQLTKRPEHGDAIVFFGESRSDAPQPIRAWFYPNETTGYEFVYPKDEATEIARKTHQRVRTMDKNARHDKNGLKGAKLGYVDEHGDASERPTATSGTKPDSNDSDRHK